MISEAMTARLKPVQPGKASLVTVLDIGSTKICCVIARLSPHSENKALRGRTHQAEVLGFAFGPSQGVDKGIITDLDAAEHAVRSVVGMAERNAGVTVQSLIVNVSAGRLSSETFAATVSLDGYEVEPRDLAKVLQTVNERSIRDERSVLHALPIGYSLDNHKGIQDPRGMVGDVLGVDVAVVSAETLSMRNIELVLNRCHLQVEAFMATPYASGLACLVDDEAQLGVAVVDFGGATTTLSVFKDGYLVYADSLSVGGQTITHEIARQLSVSFDDAERLKTLFTSVLPGQTDERDLVPIQPVGATQDEAPMQIPRTTLTRIVRPQVEDVLTILRDRMVATGMMDVCGRRFVLTGGGSELTGLPEIARRVLARNVRQGRPLGVSKLPTVAKGPAFSTVVGMLIYPQVCELEFVEQKASAGDGGKFGWFKRIGHWLKTSF